MINMNDKQLRKEVSLIIKEARLKKGLTQKQLAEKMNTHQPVIARLESGRDLPTLSFMQQNYYRLFLNF